MPFSFESQSKLMDLKHFLLQHELASGVRESLQLLDDKLQDFGLEVSTSGLSEAKIYYSWIDLFSTHFDISNYRYTFYVSALNFLMADDYLIRQLNYEELQRSLIFMTAILETKLRLKTDLIAQCMIQLACLYGKSPQRLTLYSEHIISDLQGIRDLKTCVQFHQVLFGGNLVIPGFIDTTKTNLPAFKRRMFSVLFEERSLRKTFPFLGLSKQEANLFQYGAIKLPKKEWFQDTDTVKHYRSLVRLYKHFPDHLEIILKLLNCSFIWEEHIDKFEKDLEFWIDAVRLYIRYLSKDQNIEPRTYVDYLEHKRYRSSINGNRFNLKGRTLKSISRDIEHWHRYGFLESVLKRASVSWKLKPIQSYKAELDAVIYLIEEITDSVTLYRESKELQHCVHTYLKQCINGSSRIFGLRKLNKDGFKPCCTIQLREQTVLQCKGKLNRHCTLAEQGILQMWADQNELTINLL
tara:strand:- start:15884 stop:17281 length:1398 start_codon:yes stop_codon:yes gene_type:complete